MSTLTESALSTIGGDKYVRGTGDTGDGKWIVFSAQLPKTRLLETFIPGIEASLKHHNMASSSAAQIRLRIGISHGDLIFDGSSYSGESLNHTFRIIDNEVARNALRATERNSIVMVSNDFFEKIVKPGFGSIDPESFSPLRIKNKETDTVAWLSGHGSPGEATPSTAVSSSQAILNVGRSTRRVLAIGDLAPTSLYVPITDVHNMHLYERSFPEAPIRQHLEAALLLADKVIIHCADPFRSKSVADALTDLTPSIQAGDLLFLLGENAQDPRSHFRGYIDYKVDQYGKSRYGQRDVDSLTKVDENAIDRAEQLLDLSPFALIRGFSGTDGFVRCAKRDLQASESITIREHFASSILSKQSLTIRQLLDLTQIDTDGNLHRIVTDEKSVGKLQLEVDRLASHNSFSRQILMEAIRHETGTTPDHPIDELLEERVSSVHLAGTLGPLTHLKLTSRRDRLSPYYYGHLIDHLSFLAEVPHPQTFGHGLVLELRALTSWWSFVSYHLRLLADNVQKHVTGEPSWDVSQSYGWSRRIPEFKTIRSLVRDHWT